MTKFTKTLFKRIARLNEGGFLSNTNSQLVSEKENKAAGIKNIGKK